MLLLVCAWKKGPQAGSPRSGRPRRVRSWFLHIWLCACLAGCGQEKKADTEPLPEAEASAATQASASEDAATLPARALAVETVQGFADCVFDGDPIAGLELLVTPEGFSQPELLRFLTELVAKNHVSREGLERIVTKEFGSLHERFGDAAVGVAGRASLNLGEIFAFGDVEAAVLLHWDGKRFRLAAFHQAGDSR